MINFIGIPGARLGNLLCVNFIMHLLSKKFNLLSDYIAICEYEELGFKYHIGSNSIPLMIEYTDDTIIDLLSGTDFIDHGITFNGYGQIKDIVLNYRNELDNIIQKDFEIKNGVFVHVRLDDASHNNPGIEYYRRCLNEINADCGYISSDSPNHPIVNSLIEEFNLILYDNLTIETLNFAKTFNKLVLSGGTYSWWIGVLSKASSIYYPKAKIAWHGDIFVFPEWIGIDL